MTLIHLIKIKEKKIIFTNGSHAHVENVTKQLGIDGLFDGAFDITDANYGAITMTSSRYNRRVGQCNP